MKNRKTLMQMFTHHQGDITMKLVGYEQMSQTFNQDKINVKSKVKLSKRLEKTHKVK
ncbi:hypothetical protein HYD78_00700 [Mycoplasmopsis bovis]|nr:hypothetical protein [Mycoplasmopsis bovis]QQH43236.1 hypothetical protein HYD78_00700 [Mycoplasmopsis bovis]